MKGVVVSRGSALKTGSALTALAIASSWTMPAYAADQAQPVQTPPATTAPQNTTSQSPTSPDLQPPAPGQGGIPTQAQNTQKGEQAIIITGTVSKQTQTASPVTVVSASNLQDRGITTVADAVQNLAANNAGADPVSWSSLGFATGASAPSLRGFNDAYTVTLFDGLRSAYYPLADDGYRNFVDINTIPEAIVDRIEVLQDGASANYGADAVAGVVNVIVKREIQGVHANASYGISQKGDAGEKRADLTLGYGSLGDQGFNVYINGEYQKNDALYLHDRGFPFNTADRSRICGTSVYDGSVTCGSANFLGFAPNHIEADGGLTAFGTTQVGYVLPYTQANGVPTGFDAALAPTGQFQILNPSAGCQGLTPINLTPEQIAQAGGTAPNTVCQADYINQYLQYNPKVTRKGLNLHATVNVTPDIQAYAMGNWYETSTFNQYTPLGFLNQTAAGGTLATAARIYLPVYVCPKATPVFTPSNQVYFTGCDQNNGTLNPNNPYAAQGDLARLSERYDRPRQTATDANTYRLSAGVSGNVNGFTFNVDATTSRVDLKITNFNYLKLKNLLYAVGTGQYNFVDQSANSQAARDLIAPPNTTTSTSKLSEIQGVIGKDVAELPGGALNVALGASYRTESIDNPSANPINNMDPTDRYYSVNAVSASGSRSVWSGYYSVDVPAFTGFDAKAEGRYDHYSNGMKAFSPKFELQYRPVPQLKLRGTWSRGFRIPSFNESSANGVPTTGYISTTINCAQAVNFCAAHPVAGYYSGGYSYGLSSVGNPNLKPEKSTSWTAGAVVEPSRRLSITVDYWHTRIKDIIIPATQSAAAIAGYYNCAAPCTAPGSFTVPPGTLLIPGVPDPNAPTALPLLGFYQAPYINAASEVGSGVDLSATARLPLNHSGLRLISSLSASYLAQLTLSSADNGTQKYAGTLSPCNITSCSGAPRWRGSWTNTLDFGGRASITAAAYYTSGYGFYNFNPAWADKNFIGRYFRIGARVDF